MTDVPKPAQRGLHRAAPPPPRAPPRVPPPPPRRSVSPPLASVGPPKPPAAPEAKANPKAKTKSKPKATPKSSRTPRPSHIKSSVAPAQELTLVPSPPAVEGSDSIHPEAYATVAAPSRVATPELGDRQAVSRELIAHCESELKQTSDAGRKARLHYECARLYESPLGDLDAALEHYQSARAIRALHGPTLAGLRRVHMLRRDWPSALKALSEEIELAESPDLRGALLYERALVQEQELRRAGDARRSFEAVLDQLPGDAAALRALVRAHRRDSDHMALRERLGEQATVASGDASLLAARLAERARDAERYPGKGDEAAYCYQRAADADVTGSAALLHAARLRSAQEQFSEVVSLERRRIELLSDPRLRAASLASTADVLSEQLDDTAGAIALLEEAIKTTPDDASLLRRLSHLYERIGNHEARIGMLERLHAITDDPELRLSLCLSLADAHRVRRRDPTSAIRWLQQARLLDPNNSFTLDVLAELFREQQDFEALVEVLMARETSASDLDLRAQLLVELAEVHEHHLGHVEEAIGCYKSVLSLQDAHPGALRNLLRLLQRQRRYSELVELHERAVERSLDDAEAISHLLEAALIHETLLAEPEAALGALRRVLTRDPKHLTALRGAQRLAEATGNPELAVELIDQELRLVRDDTRKLLLLLWAAELCERQLGDEARALMLLQDVLVIRANHRGALAAIARIHRRAGRHNELVQALLQEVPVVSGAAARCQHFLGMAAIIEEHLSDRQRALEYYRSAHELAPQSELPCQALERALVGTNRFDELSAHLLQRLDGLAVASERYRVAMELARIRETRLGADELAVQAFDLALEANPNSLPATLGRIRCLGRLGKFDALVQALGDVDRLTSDPAARLWGLLLAGELLEGELEQPAQAILRFEQVLGLVPDHRGALVALERLYQAEQRTEDLTRVLQQQVNCFSADPERVAAWRELMRVLPPLEQSAQIREAAARGILERQPDDVRALLELELMYLAGHHVKGLAEVDDMWVQRSQPGPMRAAHRTRLGEYLERVNPLQAVAQHRPALAEDAENLGSARGLTRLAEVVGDVALLREAAETEFSVVRNKTRAAALLGSAASEAERAGNDTAAAEILTRAVTLNPDDAANATALQQLYVRLGQHDKLINLLTAAAQAAKDPEVRAGHWISAARLMASMRGDLGAGIAALSRVALAQPGHAPTLLELAELYIRDRQWGPAAERLHKALECDPNSEIGVPARIRLAELYHEHLERTTEAAGLLRQVLEREPSNPHALRRLLAIQIQAGDAGAEETAELWARSAAAAEAAEALTTLGRLQRDRGKGQDARETLARAVALAGLSANGADRDLVRMLEKEEQADTPADWSLYAGALSSFCGGDAPPEAKVLALREASAVLIDRMHDIQRGCSALRAALGLRPYDFALQQELCRRLLQGGQHEAALPELRKLLELDPLCLQTWTDLVRAFDRLGKNAEARLVLGPLVMLGGGTDLERATWGARRPNSATIPEASIDQGALQLASGISLPDGMRALLGMLATLAPKLMDAGLERFGLTARDRIGPRSVNVERALLDRVIRMFGLHELDLYAADDESGVKVVLTEPCGVIIPQSFATLSEAEQVFTLAYQVARVAQGTHLERAVGREQTLLLLAAAAAALGMHTPMNFDDARVTETGRRLAKAVPWLSKGRFEESVRRSIADQPDDPGPLFDALHRGSLRLALIVSDDLSCLQLLRARGLEFFGIPPHASAATFQDLLKFWVSPEAMIIRRQLGLS